MKRKLIALALAAVAMAGAQAAPSFVLNAPPGWDGSYSIKLLGFESFTAGLTVGSQNFGVLKVTSISTGDGSATLWVDGQGGAEITGVFANIAVSAVIPFGANGAQVLSTGGLSNFFINPVGSLNLAGGFTQGAFGGYAAAGCAQNTLCYNGISNVLGGGSLVNTKWVAGVNDAASDAVTTINGTFISTSTPQSGFAAGFLEVTGGTYSHLFDTNGFVFSNLSNNADMRANNTFCTPGNGCSASVAQAGGLPQNGGWALKIDDPINGTMKVSEPASLALVGFALLAAGIGARRRKV